MTHDLRSWLQSLFWRGCQRSFLSSEEFDCFLTFKTHKYIVIQFNKLANYLKTSLCVFSLVLVAQLCPTLCNPMDCNPPGSSAHGVVQARILEGVAIPLPRIKLESPTFQANSLPSEPPENLMLSNPCSNEYLESGLVLGWKQAKSIVWK